MSRGRRAIATLLGMLAMAPGCAEIAGIHEPIPRGDGGGAGAGAGGGAGGAPDGGSAPCAPGTSCQVDQLVSGAYHNCVHFDAGGMKCWGRNDYGQLGLRDLVSKGDDPDEMAEHLPWIELGSQSVLSIGGGGFHTCIVTSDHALRCWGANGSGQLGLGNEADQVSPQALDELPAVDLGTTANAAAVAASYFHTCALLEGGEVECWGRNDAGQLGVGDTSDRGDDPGEMGDALSPVDLGAGTKVESIAVGLRHTCALLDDGTVKCWGYNADGRLGLGDVVNRGASAGDMGDALPPVNLGAGVVAKAITAGDSHTCALLNGGFVKCWGSSSEGQLGLGDEAPRGGAPEDMGDALPPIDLGGQKAQSISASGNHTCAVTEEGLVLCWGKNDHGQLGIGTTANAGDEPNELNQSTSDADVGKASKVARVSTGSAHTCVLLVDGSVKCWGFGLYGQLGYENGLDVGGQLDDMGDKLPTVKLLLAGQ